MAYMVQIVDVSWGDGQALVKMCSFLRVSTGLACLPKPPRDSQQSQRRQAASTRRNSASCALHACVSHDRVAMTATPLVWCLMRWLNGSMWQILGKREHSGMHGLFWHWELDIFLSLTFRWASVTKSERLRKPGWKNTFAFIDIVLQCLPLLFSTTLPVGEVIYMQNIYR